MCRVMHTHFLTTLMEHIVTELIKINCFTLNTANQQSCHEHLLAPPCFFCVSTKKIPKIPPEAGVCTMLRSLTLSHTTQPEVLLNAEAHLQIRRQSGFRAARPSLTCNTKRPKPPTHSRYKSIWPTMTLHACGSTTDHPTPSPWTARAPGMCSESTGAVSQRNIWPIASLSAVETALLSSGDGSPVYYLVNIFKTQSVI